MLRPEDIDAVVAMEAAAPAVLAELAALPPTAWTPMAAQSMYEGRWEACLLSVGPWGHEFPGVDLEANRRGLPSATALLTRFPQIGVFGVLRLAPGARLLPHRDHRADDEVRVHVPLQVPPEEAAEFTVGRARLLDIRQLHHAQNRGSIERITLVADVALGRPLLDGEVASWNPPAPAAD